MSSHYVLDACALIAFLSGEDGAELVVSLLEKAHSAAVSISVNVINLLEVYYDIYRSIGKFKADEVYMALKKLPITIQSTVSDEIFLEAGRFKAMYKISLADSIVLAETSVSGGVLLTSDHHEFDVIERCENIRFRWIR